MARESHCRVVCAPYYWYRQVVIASRTAQWMLDVVARLRAALAARKAELRAGLALPAGAPDPIGDPARRVRVVPHQRPLPRFLALLRVADVMVDTLPFTGGVSMLEAWSVGLPGAIMTGTDTLVSLAEGFARYSGLDATLRTETWAQWVALNHRLGTDAAFNARARAELRARAPRLFSEDAARQVVGEWAHALSRTVAARARPVKADLSAPPHGLWRGVGHTRARDMRARYPGAPEKWSDDLFGAAEDGLAVGGLMGLSRVEE